MLDSLGISGTFSAASSEAVPAVPVVRASALFSHSADARSTGFESTEDITLIEQVRRHPCRLGAERHVVSPSLRSLEPLNAALRIEARRRADRLSTGPASSVADVQIPP